MNVIRGDLIQLFKEGKFDAIVHGCNCFCKMGAGIAKTIATEFPSAYKEDLKTICGSKEKLGSYSFSRVDNHRVIINAYTQYRYGRGVQVSYPAIKSVFSKINNDFSGSSIAFPKIGAGLAGGDWSIISKILDKELSNVKYTLVIL